MRFEPLGMLGPLVAELPISAPSLRDGELESNLCLTRNILLQGVGLNQFPWSLAEEQLHFWKVFGGLVLKNKPLTFNTLSIKREKSQNLRKLDVTFIVLIICQILYTIYIFFYKYRIEYATSYMVLCKFFSEISKY